MTKKHRKTWRELIRTDRRRVENFDALNAAIWAGDLALWEDEDLVIDHIKAHYANGRAQGFPPVGR